MYRILQKAGATTENTWGFYTENGAVWQSEDVAVLDAMMETLIKTVPADSLLPVQMVNFTVDVVIATEPEPELP